MLSVGHFGSTDDADLTDFSAVPIRSYGRGGRAKDQAYLLLDGPPRCEDNGGPVHPLFLLLIGMAVVLGGVLIFRLHAFLALLFAALVVAVLTPVASIEEFALSRGMSETAARRLAETSAGERVAEGFGRTAGQIGIVIAMASIVGACLLESGAADRIVRSALRLFGEARAPHAFLGSGFLLGIPVFFDTVFYLMIPLGKAMRMRTGRNYLLYVLSIVAGTTMTHSLVPPTPGPLFIASELKVDMGLMIAGGCVVGLFTALSGYLFARWANRRWEVPLRESPDSLRQLEELSRRETASLPPLWLCLLPILLPVTLIAAGSALAAAPAAGPGPAVPEAPGAIVSGIVALGDKNIALVLAALAALGMQWRFTSGERTLAAIRSALASAGVIILITSAGGAFGGVLQQTGIGAAIERLAATYQLAVLPLVFVLTVLIRTAQGSATVAMITAAGVFSGMAGAAQLGFHPLYVALTIGCGSKPIWWMNDSGFWVVTQMSGLTEREALKTLTPLALIMGLVGLVVTLLGARLFPLV